MTRQARIVHVVEACAAGVGRHVIDLIEGLASLGYDTALVYSPMRCDERFAAGLQRLQAKQVPVVSVAMRRGLGVLADPAAAVGVLRAIGAFPGATLVHTHSASAGVLGRVAARFRGLKVVHTPNGVAWSAVRGRATRGLIVRLERQLAHWTDAIIAVSTEEAANLRVAGVIPRRCTEVIENGIPAPRCSEHVDLRAILGVAPDVPIVGCVGRLEYQKDPELFIDIAHAVLKEHPRLCVFVWVGDGSLMGGCRGRVQDRRLDGRVRFLGHRNDAEGCYHSFAVFCLTSRYEGLSYAVLEAMRAGVPVVAPAVEGVASVIGGAGLVVEPRTATAMAAAVTSLLQSPNLRAEFSRGALAAAAERSAERMARATAQLYEHVLKNVSWKERST